jgi:hypothetical protein
MMRYPYFPKSNLLTEDGLEEDLEKFEKLDQLNPFERQFLFNPLLYSIDPKDVKPFRLLVYFKTPKKFKGIEDLLTRYIKFWDAVLLVDKEEILLNRNLPIIKKLDDVKKLR